MPDPYPFIHSLSSASLPPVLQGCAVCPLARNLHRSLCVEAEGSWLASGLYRAILWTQLRCGDEKPNFKHPLKVCFPSLRPLS